MSKELILTPLEPSLARHHADFVRHLARGLSPEHAAREAGLKHPAEVGRVLVQTKAIQVALRAEQARFLTTELVPKAYGVLKKVLDDKRQAAREKLKAAEIVLRLGQQDSPEDDEAKRPEDMTIAELEALVAKQKRDLNVIDVEPEPLDVTPGSALKAPEDFDIFS